MEINMINFYDSTFLAVLYVLGTIGSMLVFTGMSYYHRTITHIASFSNGYFILSFAMPFIAVLCSKITQSIFNQKTT
jgi:hypothetical protein